MKVVVVIAALNLQHGGPTRTLPALCRALVSEGANIELFSIAESGRRAVDLGISEINHTVIEATTSRYQPQSWSKQFKGALWKALSEKETVLYDVGLWLPSNHFAAQMAGTTDTPFVTSPRGMLSKEALNVSKWKKKVAWCLYQRRDLARARVLHATSHKEAEEFRALGLKQPIAVVPNGVSIPKGIETSQVTGHKLHTALFLSRLHPMKGLKDLVQAWAKIHPQGWRLVIAGPDEKGHRAECEELARSFGIAQDLEFLGAVDDQQKWKLLAQSDLFVLPSYSESFGMAIAEALAAGVPVITTKATPWQAIETHQCGWWVNVGAQSIAEALAKATRCTREELREKGARGRRLVQENYSWESAAKNLISVFQWILGRAERPDCVV